jgi:signal transduction histidine kinase
MQRADQGLGQRRRTVATRVLLSYLIVMTAFALVAGWSWIALRQAAREAELMRTGYLPLALALRDVRAHQETWNTQLNQITAARNPAHIGIWFKGAGIDRPRKFQAVQSALARSLSSSSEPTIASVGRELQKELVSIEQAMAPDRERLDRLFEALHQRDQPRSERISDELVKRGSESERRLRALEERVKSRVDGLVKDAERRETLAIKLLIALAAVTMLVGLIMALYARRVLKPLAIVTERAKSVGRGDLTPRPVLASNDEIGELSSTFEGMVSAIARANEQLLATERLATIGKMAAHVTHEIRNPLSSIALNLELLEEELGAENAEARGLLRAISAEVDRLTALSEQYLSVARRQPLRMEDEDIGQVVREAAEFIRRDLERHGVILELAIDRELPSVRLDEGQLKQALFNLIRNAREAMASGGTVTISVHHAAGGGVDVMVDDQGRGMDAEARARLFEPFFTTKKHGTGLGLPITRQIVEAHGGTIACEARPEGGTRIWLHLPESVERRETPLPEPYIDTAPELRATPK